MQTRIQLQPAYVLHSRPFQNSSLLLDLFCLEHGRIRAIAKGARSEKSKYRAHLQLFHPILVSYSGKGEVKTVTNVEASTSAIRLEGEGLFSGLYLNELLTRLLHLHVEHGELFRAYQEALLGLQAGSVVEPVLRQFELALLAELGYAINLEEDCRSHDAIVAEALYRFTPDVGFERAQQNGEGGSKLFSGAHIIALRKGELQDGEAARSAKRLLRAAINAHLGDKPLNSRSLFS